MSTQKLGRPKSRDYDPAGLQTRITENIVRMLKQIVANKYKNATEMYQDMINQFLTEKPYNHGLQWRTPKSVKASINGESMDTGWILVAIQVRPEIKEEVLLVCAGQDISVATFCYTAIFWWIEYKN